MIEKAIAHFLDLSWSVGSCEAVLYATCNGMRSLVVESVEIRDANKDAEILSQLALNPKDIVVSVALAHTRFCRLISPMRQ